MIDTPLWDRTPPSYLATPSFWRGLEDKINGLLRTINVWPDELARTCSGSICVDPGWNYLVDVGLSLTTLATCPGINSIRNGLAGHPPLIYQLTLAGWLKRRGILSELEPETGIGNHKNDFTVAAEGLNIDLELKVLTSNRPGANLEKEIMVWTCPDFVDTLLRCRSLRRAFFVLSRRSVAQVRV
jgi:hypothetical protein